MVFHADYEPVFDKKETCEIQVGDLVRLRDYDWISRNVGIVTEVKELIHDMSHRSYYAVTVVVNDKEYTFSHRDFELISKAERDSK
tara:strand:- start:298 stop:555 length:258 start_codon:yes stop_codon:yes gene_type:complete